MPHSYCNKYVAQFWFIIEALLSIMKWIVSILSFWLRRSLDLLGCSRVCINKPEELCISYSTFEIQRANSTHADRHLVPLHTEACSLVQSGSDTCEALGHTYRLYGLSRYNEIWGRTVTCWRNECDLEFHFQAQVNARLRSEPDVLGWSTLAIITGSFM
jgi:hypothetical protein